VFIGLLFEDLHKVGDLEDRSLRDEAEGRLGSRHVLGTPFAGTGHFSLQPVRDPR
jgi:hypothetical protein